MKILWLTWKDHTHPGAGGAEVVLRELSERLVAAGHEVTWLTCGYPGAAVRERLNGIDVIRVGSNRYIHPLQALLYFARRLRGQFDIVIEVVNTAPYFGVFFAGHAKKYLFYHQLAREVWFYEAPAPISQFGYYALEPFATRLLSKAKAPVITVSDSTRADLARHGFKVDHSHIISEGIEIEPLADLRSVKKYSRPTLLSLGAMRAMKRTLDQVEAFELARQCLPGLQLKLAGDASGSYGQKVLTAIRQSPFTNDIEYLGRVSKADKVRLMQKSHVILQTALKEGWGLTITEAAAQGTPAAVYDVDGLRDSVRDNETGIITAANPEALSDGIIELLTDKAAYEDMRRAAWQWSRTITFDQSYKDLVKVLELV
jgi:glycosyltransferase involved in cell wall biosynthesis